MAYEIYLSRLAWDFLRLCRGKHRELILSEIDALGNNPFRKGDFQETNQSGRRIEVLIVAEFAIHYWADHAVKELKIIGLRLADR